MKKSNSMKIDNMSRIKIGLLIAILFVVAQFVYAQTLVSIPFDSSHWNIQAKAITTENFQGKECIKITDGAAYLKDNFESEVIEFDIAFDKERCFPGLTFRMVDDKYFEFSYLRPHQSGNLGAIQYCPIIYGNDSWQLYTGEGYCAQTDFAVSTWIHVKVIISGKQGELFLNNASSSTLFMHQLQREPLSSGLALDNHSPDTVRFANFSYSKENNPAIKSAKKSILPLAAGVIKKWHCYQRIL